MPLVTVTPEPMSPRPASRTARVAVVRTRPETVIEDYARVMDLAGYRDVLSRDRDTLLKLNLSWTKYFPACSSQPWQVDGVVRKMLGDGFERAAADSRREQDGRHRTRAKAAATTGGSRC